MTAILQTKSLFISAGHSSSDPGAVAGGFTEASVVTSFRDALANELRAKGIEFAKDGRRGENLPLRDAIEKARQHDVAVEFHCNAATNPSATGTETLSRPDDYPLGAVLCKAISETLGIANRGPDGAMSRQHSRFGFIRDGGGIIVELFFITNPGDMASYLRNKDALVKAVARVLIDEVAPPNVYRSGE